MKFYTRDELFEELKPLDSDILIFLHVFPFFDTDMHRFYTYLCDVRSAIGLTAMISYDAHYTFKIQ